MSKTTKQPKRETKIRITEVVFLGKFDLVEYIHSKMLEELKKMSK